MTAYGTRRAGKVALFLAAVVLPATLLAPTASPSASVASLSMLGADVSTGQRALDLGAKYYDANGTAGDPLDILKGVRVNYVRLRVWNNPRSCFWHGSMSTMSTVVSDINNSGNEWDKMAVFDRNGRLLLNIRWNS